MATGHKNGLMEMPQPLDGRSRTSIIRALYWLAEARQASVSDSTFTLYTTELLKWPIDDVISVCDQVAASPIKEGEKAFPALGNIFEELRNRKIIRRREADCQRSVEDIEEAFWKHVEYRMELEGKSEQEILDTIKKPGFTGRKARNRSDLL